MVSRFEEKENHDKNSQISHGESLNSESDGFSCTRLHSFLNSMLFLPRIKHVSSKNVVDAKSKALTSWLLYMVQLGFLSLCGTSHSFFIGIAGFRFSRLHFITTCFLRVCKMVGKLFKTIKVNQRSFKLDILSRILEVAPE